MIVPLRYAGQAVVYAAFAALLGYFSNAPAYERVPSGSALIKLAFAHGAERKGDCRRLTHEELMELAPNMRKPVVCPRERVPVTVELTVDGEVLYEAVLPPTGLSGDGPSRAYQRFTIPAGAHTIGVRLNDTGENAGNAGAFDYVTERDVVLAPSEILAIDFQAKSGGFIFQ